MACDISPAVTPPWADRRAWSHQLLLVCPRVSDAKTRNSDESRAPPPRWASWDSWPCSPGPWWPCCRRCADTRRYCLSPGTGSKDINTEHPSGVLFSLGKEGQSDSCHHLAEPWGHEAKRKKPVTEEHKDSTAWVRCLGSDHSTNLAFSKTENSRAVAQG